MGVDEIPLKMARGDVGPLDQYEVVLIYINIGYYAFIGHLSTLCKLVN